MTQQNSLANYNGYQIPNFNDFQPYQLPNFSNQGTGQNQSLATPAYPSYQQRQAQGKSGNGSVITQAQPDGGMDFFNGDTVMGKLGSGMNLVGSGVSLVSMIRNMQDARKNHETNRGNIRQQMDQSRKAFNRDVARQDSTLAGIAARDKRVAEMNQ